MRYCRDLSSRQGAWQKGNAGAGGGNEGMCLGLIYWVLISKGTKDMGPGTETA